MSSRIQPSARNMTKPDPCSRQAHTDLKAVSVVSVVAVVVVATTSTMKISSVVTKVVLATSWEGFSTAVVVGSEPVNPGVVLTWSQLRLCLLQIPSMA